MPNQDIFDKYKPLRNNLKKLPLNDVMSVSRAYEQFIQFGSPLPKDIEVEQRFLDIDKKGRMAMLTGWDLEIYNIFMI